MHVTLPFPSNSSSSTCIGVGFRVIMSFLSASSIIIENMQTDKGKSTFHIRIYEISYSKI